MLGEGEKCDDKGSSIALCVAAALLLELVALGLLGIGNRSNNVFAQLCGMVGFLSGVLLCSPGVLTFHFASPHFEPAGVRAQRMFTTYFLPPLFWGVIIYAIGSLHRWTTPGGAPPSDAA